MKRVLGKVLFFFIYTKLASIRNTTKVVAQNRNITSAWFLFGEMTWLHTWRSSAEIPCWTELTVSGSWSWLSITKGGQTLSLHRPELLLPQRKDDPPPPPHQKMRKEHQKHMPPTQNIASRLLCHCSWIKVMSLCSWIKVTPLCRWIK